MKITDVKVYVVDPPLPYYGSSKDREWTFVQIDTDEGITGWGEATNYPGGGSFLSAQAILLQKEVLVGEDPADIERIWHKLYRRYTYLGARGLPTTAISGIDIALWDIKGKALGKPIYDLLGGKFRDSIRLYAESRIDWFEEPVPPEGYDALRAVREQVQCALCVGERLFTRWDFLPIFQQRLADYVMPDVVWTGGISELKKIATMAEAYFVPISPHNAMGPLQVVAGAHVMMTVPNFYRLEHSTAAIPAYNLMLMEPIHFQGNEVRVSGKPGLGVELNLEVIQAHLHPNSPR